VSELRRGLIARALAEILIDSHSPIAAGQVLEELERRVELNERELSRNNAGQRRFDTFARFFSGWLSGAGLIDKGDAGWLITPLGRQVYADNPGPAWLAEVGRRYRAALAAKKLAAGWSEPRWQTVREAMESIPDGSWCAYKDLGDLVDAPPGLVVKFINGNDVPNAHRVLTIDGRVADDFTWSDPERTDDPRELLEAEGVDFDVDGRANSERRFTAADLREFVAPVSQGARAWLVRGSAVGGVNLVPRWLEEGFVSLAASHLRPVEPPLSLDELRRIVEDDYGHLTYNQRLTKVAEIHSFLSRMSAGDAVVTTTEGMVHVGRITGQPTFAGGDDARVTLQREVEWDPAEIAFTELPEALRNRLASSTTIIDLTEVSESIEALFTGVDVETTTPMKEVHLARLSAEQADGLLVGREWLDELVDLLDERRQVVLYGPPGTGKTYLALEVANRLTDPGNVTLVQFHPAYSYEDFFEGYRPNGGDEGGGMVFTLTPGPFRKIVDRASADPQTPYFLIVDEINRANLAKVFGELYFLLEYRDRTIELMYTAGDAGRDFRLPKNVYLIGTMNTADRSIALVDSAMRRRFAFLSLHPDDEHLSDVLPRWLDENDLPPLAGQMWVALNARIEDDDYKVGPSYFMRRSAGTEDGLRRLWRTSIMPLLEELHYGDDAVDVQARYGFDVVLRAVRPAAAVTALVEGEAVEGDLEDAGE
jgi:5-methylcytosine-specific restriction protein B